MDYSGLWILMSVAGPALLLAALIYGVVRWRSRLSVREEMQRDRKTREIYREGAREERAEELSPSIAPKDVRRSEDEIARERLGGSRGAPELGDAPMVPQQAKNTPRNYEPGHTA
jgi:hypothetical protein